MPKGNTVDKGGEPPYRTSRISIIAALGRDNQNNRVIGKDNQLLWHIPDDLKRFKLITFGHPVIMGRKTFESLPENVRPLPGRTNIVITHNPAWSHAGVIAAHSLDEALRKARVLDRREIFICGGTQIYEQAFHLVDRLYLTLIDDEKEGDAHFPPYEKEFTKVISDESREWNGINYRWVTLERT